MKIGWVVLWRRRIYPPGHTDGGANYVTLYDAIDRSYYRSRAHQPILHNTKQSAEETMACVLRQWGEGDYVIRVVPRRVR